LEEKQRPFPLTVVQIPLQQGWYLQQTFLPSKITAQNTAFSCLSSEDPVPHQTMQALGKRAAVHPPLPGRQEHPTPGLIPALTAAEVTPLPWSPFS